jgi:hypothetical protein
MAAPMSMPSRGASSSFDRSWPEMNATGLMQPPVVRRNAVTHPGVSVRNGADLERGLLARVVAGWLFGDDKVARAGRY